MNYDLTSDLDLEDKLDPNQQDEVLALIQSTRYRATQIQEEEKQLIKSKTQFESRAS